MVLIFVLVIRRTMVVVVVVAVVAVVAMVAVVAVVAVVAMVAMVAMRVVIVVTVWVMLPLGVRRYAKSDEKVTETIMFTFTAP